MTAPEGTNAKSPRAEWLWPTCFALVLAIHFVLVTRSWSAGELRGHEFRQAQTAISAHYIQAENNFSLAYPTPLLGKPWAVPMEFPLYQWCAVGVSNAGNIPLVEAGRAVSLACFYLMLPGTFLLLARMGIAPGARWLVLALVAACPLYIFYTRAFLIEAMALMFSVWFLAAFVASMQTRGRAWLLLAAAAGIGAALVKVTTFLMWLVPAVGYGAVLLWRARTRGGAEVLRTAAWGAVAGLGPCAAAIWWVRTADAIKALNPSGRFLMSGAMQWFNFGPWSERFTGKTWFGVLAQWHEVLMPLWLTALVLVALVFLAGRSRPAGGWAIAAMLAALFTFPRLFAWHDYYFYAIGVIWLGAAGLALHAAMARLPRVAGVVLVFAVLGAQLGAYATNYYRLQNTSGNGGNGLTNALRDLTARDGVLVTLGNDWSAVLPYHARRRALMIRTSTEYDDAYITTALAQLDKTEVTALVVSGTQRENAKLIARIIQAYDLHPEAAFSHGDTDVYLPRDRRDWTVAKLHAARVYDQVEPRGAPPAHAAAPEMDRQVKTVSPTGDRDLFGHMAPMPVRYRFAFDANLGEIEGQRIVTAHPDAEIWFAPPTGMKEIAIAFGLLPGAYEREGDKTDGVEFIIAERRPDGTESEIFRRKLEPALNPGDRGLQSAVIPCRPAGASQLVFKTRPVGNYAFDWAYWGPITLR